MDASRQTVSYYHKGDRSYEEEYGAYKNITDNQLVRLRGSEQIEIVGLCGDYCVKETAAILMKIWPEKVVLLPELIASIDDGSTLSRFIEENNIKTR